MENEPMTEGQRALFLINNCCGGSAINFARAIGIDKTRLSKIVHGQYRLSRLFSTILTAFPNVNPEWLRTGEGYPGDLTVSQVRMKYEAMLAEKDALIRTLQKIIEEKL